MKALVGFQNLINFLESEIEKKDQQILKLEKEINDLKLYNFVEVEKLNNEMGETIDDIENLFKNYTDLEDENLKLKDLINNFKNK
jgi:predicted  nucleic acid-binding Zn-ribbon protein